MFKISSSVIKAAAASTRGVLSLSCLILGSIALVFFRDAPVEVRLIVFTLCLLGVVGFGMAMFKENQDAGEKVTVLDAKSFPFSGRWSLQIRGPAGDAASYIDYHADGRFEGVEEFFGGNQGQRIAVSGHWTLTPLNRNEFKIGFTYDNGTKVDVRFRIIDLNSILNLRMNCVVCRLSV